MNKQQFRVIAQAFVVALASASGAAHAATLTHFYDFTSGVTDLVGTQNGALFGNANLAGGRLNLDGNGDYVQFSALIVPTSGSYSISLFAARSVNQGTFTEIISQGQSGGPGFYIGTDPAGRIRATDQWASTGVASGAVGSMTHYALVVDSTATTSNLYVNGSLAATLPSAIATGSDGTATRLGRQFGSLNEYFNGSIDNVGIYSGALTSNEVSLLASPVPENSTLALMTLGLLALPLVRRRK